MNQQKLNNCLYIILIALVCIVIYKLYTKQENFAGATSSSCSCTTQSNLAIKNIASVYADTSGTVAFNNVTVTGNLNFAQFKGIIVAWSGVIADIPTGWGFCDGSTYTALDGSKIYAPDLRSLFIIGASKPGTPTNTTVSGPNGQPIAQGIGWLTPRQVGNYGGEEYHQLSIAEMPEHSHNYFGNTWQNTGGFCFSDGCGLYAQPNGVSSPTGGNASHNNMPPYFALAYIIKL